MNENQKPLDQKTLDRMAREWDRRVGKQKSFSLHAKVTAEPDGTEQDTISVVNYRGQSENENPFYTQVIEHSEMDNDLRPTESSQKPLDQKTLDRMAREWDKGIAAKKPFSVTGQVYRTPFGTEQDIVTVRNHELFTGEQSIYEDEMDNDIRTTEASQKSPQRGIPPQK